MNDILNETRAAIGRAVEKAAPVAEDVKEKVGAAVENLKEKATPVVENLKEKAAPVMEDMKEKAAPVVEKVKAGVDSAVDAVKDGAEKIGDLLTPDAPGLNVKNELFDELEEQVRSQKEASMNAAEEMHKRMLELMKKQQ